MPSIDFDALAQWVDLSENARQMLIRPEKQIVLNLSVRLANEDLLMTDCYVVLQNAARGPAKGGIRLAPNVTLAETRDLAERMVWKTALVGIPFGGGKSGIRLDPSALSFYARVAIFKEYVHVLQHELMTGAYVPAPDLGTGPSDMAVIYGETHLLESVTGKPPRVGGLPGRLEATGRGVSAAAQMALEAVLRQDITGSTVAVQGFGNVGGCAAQFLHQAGARVVAVPRSRPHLRRRRPARRPRHPGQRRRRYRLLHRMAQRQERLHHQQGRRLRRYRETHRRDLRPGPPVCRRARHHSPPRRRGHRRHRGRGGHARTRMGVRKAVSPQPSARKAQRCSHGGAEPHLRRGPRAVAIAAMARRRPWAGRRPDDVTFVLPRTHGRDVRSRLGILAGARCPAATQTRTPLREG